MGQAMDIAWHRSDPPTPLPTLREYDLMCRLKTGCLARLAAILGVYAAAAAGAIAPGDISGWADSLGDAAENMGVGFQILDDVKNLTTGNSGKKRGDDIVEGKKSLPALLYLHSWKHDPAQAAALVSRCFAAARAGGVAVPEVEELIVELESSGALAEAKRQGLALIDDARGAFSGLNLGGSGLLMGLIESIS